MSMNEIYPGLWLGDISSSVDKSFLTQKKITMVINCTVTAPFTDLKTVRHHRRLPVKDNREKDQIYILYRNIDTLAILMHAHLKSGENLLVHCHAGRQRSAALVAGFLMKYSDLEPEETISLIRTKRSVVGIPMINFKDALLQYHEDLTKFRLSSTKK